MRSSCQFSVRPFRSYRYRMNTASRSGSPLLNRAENTRGSPRGWTSWGSIPDWTRVRAGHLALLKGSNTRLAAMEDSVGRHTENITSRVMTTSAPASIWLAKRASRSPLNEIALALFSTSITVRRARGPSGVPSGESAASENSTPLASLPRMAGFFSSTLKAIWISEGRKRNAGTMLRRTTRPNALNPARRRIIRNMSGNLNMKSRRATTQMNPNTPITTTARRA